MLVLRPNWPHVFPDEINGCPCACLLSIHRLRRTKIERSSGALWSQVCGRQSTGNYVVTPLPWRLDLTRKKGGTPSGLGGGHGRGTRSSLRLDSRQFRRSAFQEQWYRFPMYLSGGWCVLNVGWRVRQRFRTAFAGLASSQADFPWRWQRRSEQNDDTLVMCLAYQDHYGNNGPIAGKKNKYHEKFDGFWTDRLVCWGQIM